MTAPAWADALRGEGPVAVTGAAGFIGFHVSMALLDAGVPVVGVDNLSAAYDPALAAARLAALEAREGFALRRLDIADGDALAAAMRAARPRRVVHLAAQAGVRRSIAAPRDYARANVEGFLAVLEACRALDVAHLVYASSSSVYGGNARLPYAADDRVDHPVSFYAATKRANELTAHVYAHLHGLPATGARLFTVYGPWGRPDMAYWRFAEAILEDRPIDVYNDGNMRRDFTYVDDAVEALLRLLARPAAPDPAFDAAAPAPSRSWAPHRIYNVGESRSEGLLDMIAILERALGRPARRRLLPMQPGDVRDTWADVGPIAEDVGWRPAVGLAQGLPRFVAWYLDWRRRAG